MFLCQTLLYPYRNRHAEVDLSLIHILVNMLMLADIPVRAKDRDESYPIVCGGGPCAYNAEPVADIFDFFMLRCV